MRQKSVLILLAFLLTICVSGQETAFIQQDLEIEEELKGTLLKPKGQQEYPLVIIIPGSGPTDRNGNQKHLKNNSLKQLAERLSSNNIATFRYDKRILQQLKNDDFKEEKVSFDGFIEDAKTIVKYFKKSPRYTKIYIAGHSQGSLVGMVAAQEHVDGFISIAGAGQSIDKVIEHQVENTAPSLANSAKEAFNKMRKGKIAKDYDPQLETLFRKSVQPFMISWMKYDPTVEIKKLTIPVLLINGDKDLQVPVSEAETLKEHKPDATLKIIKDMNHVLKQIDGEGKYDTNATSYTNPNIPLSDELVNVLIDFIK